MSHLFGKIFVEISPSYLIQLWTLIFLVMQITLVNCHVFLKITKKLVWGSALLSYQFYFQNVIFCFWDLIWQYSPGWPGYHYITRLVLKSQWSCLCWDKWCTASYPIHSKLKKSKRKKIVILNLSLVMKFVPILWVLCRTFVCLLALFGFAFAFLAILKSVLF